MIVRLKSIWITQRSWYPCYEAQRSQFPRVPWSPWSRISGLY